MAYLKKNFVPPLYLPSNALATRKVLQRKITNSFASMAWDTLKLLKYQPSANRGSDELSPFPFSVKILAGEQAPLARVNGLPRRSPAFGDVGGFFDITF
jgi:hypothetical protein